MTSPSFRGETVNVAGLIHSLSLSSRGYLETVGCESEGHVDTHTQLDEEVSGFTPSEWVAMNTGQRQARGCRGGRTLALTLVG